MNRNQVIDCFGISSHKSLTKYLCSQSSRVVAGTIMSLGITLTTFPVNALSYVTTINYTNPVTIGTNTIGSIRLNWSTNLSSGLVTESNLTDWSISLILTNGSTLYTDNVIVGGIVQPINATDPKNRSITDIDFNFNFGTNTLNPFDNDLLKLQSTATSGLSYHIYTEGSPPTVLIVQYDNTSSSGQGNTNQDTQEIPFEFSPIGGLLLLGIGHGIKRKFNKSMLNN